MNSCGSKPRNKPKGKRIDSPQFGQSRRCASHRRRLARSKSIPQRPVGLETHADRHLAVAGSAGEVESQTLGLRRDAPIGARRRSRPASPCAPRREFPVALRGRRRSRPPAERRSYAKATVEPPCHRGRFRVRIPCRSERRLRTANEPVTRPASPGSFPAPGHSSNGAFELETAMPARNDSRNAGASALALERHFASKPPVA